MVLLHLSTYPKRFHIEAGSLGLCLGKLRSRQGLRISLVSVWSHGKDVLLRKSAEAWVSLLSNLLCIPV